VYVRVNVSEGETKPVQGFEVVRKKRKNFDKRSKRIEGDRR
jgi:hypothetical protein